MTKNKTTKTTKNEVRKCSRNFNVSSFDVNLLSIIVIGLSIVPEAINFFYNQFLNVHTALKFSSLFNISSCSNFKEERRKSESAFKKKDL